MKQANSAINDDDLNQQVNLLHILGGINAITIEAAQTVRAHPSVLQVKRACDIRNYKELSVFEAYLETEMRSGIAYCWWLEIRYSGGLWVVDRSLRKTTASGQDVVEEFPDQTFRTIRELNENAHNLAQVLFSAAMSFDFDTRG